MLVLASADGTAAIALGPRFVVRPPGGRFGRPVRLGASAEVEDLAVAPGGWAAAVGGRSRPLALRSQLRTAVVAPGGGVRWAAVDRAVGTRVPLGAAIGIDAAGMAIVAWVRTAFAGGRNTVNVGRSLPAGGWSPPQTLAAAPRTWTEVALAVSPAGRVLLAWTGRGASPRSWTAIRSRRASAGGKPTRCRPGSRMRARRSSPSVSARAGST